MGNTTQTWEWWFPPYDPRLADGAIVCENAAGRMIQIADCGQRCPGCGMCCSGYRDEVGETERGTEEHEENQRLLAARPSDDLVIYQPAHCEADCPGYGRCCPPFELRQRPEDVADTRRVLLERDDSARWEMQEALLILAHDGSQEAVNILRAFQPRAHARLEGFAECALDEGEYFNTVPRNDAEACAMIQQGVRDDYEKRSIEAQVEIEEDICPKIEHLRYELEIVRRLMDKTTEPQAKDDWRIQSDVLEMLISQEEERKAEREADITRYEAMIAEIEADLRPNV